MSGIFFICSAVFFFCIMGAGVKLLPNIPFYEIVFFRSLISFLICGTIIKIHHLPLLSKKNHLPLLLARGVAGTFGICCMFYCIHKLNFAYAITLQQMTPLFTIIFSAVLSKSKLKIHQVFSAIIALSGVYYVYHTHIDEVDWYVTIGILGALFSATAYNIVHILRNKEPATVVIFYFPLVSIPITFILMIFDWKMPSIIESFILLFVGLTTHIAQQCLTLAYQKEKPENIAIYNHFSIVLACLISYFFFNETMTKEQVIGISIIIIGIVYSSYATRQAKRLSY